MMPKTQAEYSVKHVNKECVTVRVSSCSIKPVAMIESHLFRLEANDKAIFASLHG